MFRIVETPWRYRYILSSVGGRGGECFFCEYAAEPDKDEENNVFYRGRRVFGLLNRYPYMWGHVMLAPYRHVADLSELSIEELSELLKSTFAVRDLVADILGCRDFLIGVNVGRAAGAGVEGHLHVHIIPGCRAIDPSTSPEELEKMLYEYNRALSRAWS